MYLSMIKGGTEWLTELCFIYTDTFQMHIKSISFFNNFLCFGQRYFTEDGITRSIHPILLVLILEKGEPNNPAGDRMHMWWSQYSKYWNNNETFWGRNRTLLFPPQRVSARLLERKHAFREPCCFLNSVASWIIRFPFQFFNWQ